MPARPTMAELRTPFIRVWRITSTDCFERAYLDLGQEARLVVPVEGSGEMRFGALIAELDFSFSPGTLFFDWHGSDEMDESWGEGVMELTTPRRATIDLEYFTGDEAVLKASKMGNN